MYAANRETVEIFQHCQWEYSAMGHPIGIRPGDIRETMWLLNVDETEKTRIFQGIRLMQSIALNTLNANAKKD